MLYMHNLHHWTTLVLTRARNWFDCICLVACPSWKRQTSFVRMVGSFVQEGMLTPLLTPYPSFNKRATLNAEVNLLWVDHQCVDEHEQKVLMKKQLLASPYNAHVKQLIMRTRGLFGFKTAQSSPGTQVN